MIAEACNLMQATSARDCTRYTGLFQDWSDGRGRLLRGKVRSISRLYCLACHAMAVPGDVRDLVLKRHVHILRDHGRRRILVLHSPGIRSRNPSELRISCLTDIPNTWQLIYNKAVTSLK